MGPRGPSSVLAGRSIRVSPAGSRTPASERMRMRMLSSGLPVRSRSMAKRPYNDGAGMERDLASRVEDSAKPGDAPPGRAVWCWGRCGFRSVHAWTTVPGVTPQSRRRPSMPSVCQVDGIRFGRRGPALPESSPSIHECSRPGGVRKRPRDRQIRRFTNWALRPAAAAGRGPARQPARGGRGDRLPSRLMRMASSTDFTCSRRSAVEPRFFTRCSHRARFSSSGS